jgi:hypothetical protein
MMEILATRLFPTALFVVAALLIFGALRLANALHRRHGDPFPMGPLTREPAHSKRRRQRALEVDIFWHAIAVPTLLFAWYYALTQSLSANGYGNLTDLIVIVAAGIVAMAYFIQHLVRLVKAERRLALQTSAEVATGQFINQLMRRGYWVFHDIILGERRIQHLIIGPTGVFVVESKAHRVPRKYRKSNTERAEAQFDGSQVIYPDWVDTDPIQAVMIRASGVGKWMTVKSGEPIVPQPVIPSCLSR